MVCGCVIDNIDAQQEAVKNNLVENDFLGVLLM